MDEISVAEVALPNLKLVRAHIGANKGEQALDFLRFLLKNGPLSVVRVFFQEDCPDNMHNKLLDLEKKFSKSRFSVATRKRSMKGKWLVNFVSSSGRFAEFGYGILLLGMW